MRAVVDKKHCGKGLRVISAAAVAAICGTYFATSPGFAANVPNGGTLNFAGTAQVGGLATQVYNITPPGTVVGFNNVAFLQANSSFNGAAPVAGNGGQTVFYGAANTTNNGNGTPFNVAPTAYGITNANNYFARFSGYFTAPSTGSYLFGLSSDDGSVMYINGQQVVNDNFYQGENTPPTVQQTGSISLNAGQVYEMVIGYYQGGGGAGVTAFYNPPAPANDTQTGTTQIPIPVLDSGNVQILTGAQAFVDFTTNGTADPNVNVPAGTSGTLAIQYVLSSKLNALTLNGNGVSTNAGLTIQGSAVRFNTTTFTSGGTINFAPSASSANSQDIAFGQATDGGTAVSIVKAGYNAILLDNVATGASADSFVSGTSFNIQGGSLVVNGMNGGSNPLGSAGVILSAPTGFGATAQNSTLTLSSQSGAVTFDNAVSIAAGATANIIAQQANQQTAGNGPQTGVAGITSASVGNVTITLGGVNSLTVPGTSTLNLSSVNGDTLALGAPFTIQSGGTLAATAGNVNVIGGAVTGTLTVSGASLNINTAALTGAGTINVTSGSANVNFVNGFTGAINLSGGVMNENIVSAFALSSGIHINSGGTLNVNAADSNSANVIVNGGGIFELSQDQGGATPGIVPTAAIGGIVQLNNVNQSAGYNLALNGGTIEAVNGARTDASNVALTGNVTFGGAGQNLADTGNITGGGNLNKAGSETITLSGSNSYSGTTTVSAGTLLLNSPIVSTTETITGGTLQLGVTGALPSTASVAVGGTLDLNGHSQTVSALSGGGLVTNSASTSATFTVTGTNTFGGTITDGGTTAKSLALVVPTGATLTLTGTGTFVGGTTIASGARLNANSSTALGAGAVSLNGGTLSVGGQPGGSPIYVTGFGPSNAFTTPSNFKLNGSATFPSAGVLQLTDGNGGEAGSAFFTTQQTLANLTTSTGFTAQYTYKEAGNGPADGSAFVLQNSANGASAVGNSGGALGYGGINNSFGFEINIYGPNNPGIATRTGGATGTPYASTGSVNVASGDPIAVTLNYNGSTNVMTETLTDTTTNATFTTSATVNIATAIGGNSFYVGFTGGTGGAASTQTITNFTLSSGAVLSSNASIINALNVNTTSTLESNISAGSILTVGPVNFASGSTLNVTPGVATGSGAYSVVTGATTLAGPATVNVANNGSSLGSLTLGAVGDGGGNFSLTKTGPGALLLSSTNTYGGNTIVQQGILGGNGSFGKNGTSVMLSSGATLAPSAMQAVAVGAASRLNITGSSVAFATSGSILGASLAQPDNGQPAGSGSNAGTGYDQIVYNTTFSLGNAILSINDSTYATGTPSPAVGNKFYIVDSGPLDVNGVTGSFSNLSAGNLYTSPSGIVYHVQLNQPGDPSGSGEDVLLTVQAVPEPASLSLLGLGVVGLLTRRRRRS